MGLPEKGLPEKWAPPQHGLSLSQASAHALLVECRFPSYFSSCVQVPRTWRPCGGLTRPTIGRMSPPPSPGQAGLVSQWVKSVHDFSPCLFTKAQGVGTRWFGQSRILASSFLEDLASHAALLLSCKAMHSLAVLF